VLGCPESVRGIAFVKDSDGSGTPCLKLLAHLELGTIEPTGMDEEIGLPSFVLHGWALTTWSNTKMSVSWKDWRQDHRVESSDIEVDCQLASRLLHSGLLCEPQGSCASNYPKKKGSCAAAAAAKGARPRALSNLLSHPVPGIGAADQDVVRWPLARVKFLHPKAWALAVDMRNSKLLVAAEFGTVRQPREAAIYFPSSTISSYTNPETPAGGSQRKHVHQSEA